MEGLCIKGADVSKLQVQGPSVPGWTVDPESLGLYRDRPPGTWSCSVQDSLLGPSLDFIWLHPVMILENSRTSELGSLEELAQPLTVDLGKLRAREGTGLSRSHNDQLQGAGLGSRTPEMWFQLCHCLTVHHWASGHPCP